MNQVYSCAAHAEHDGAPLSVQKGNRKHLVVDIHCHIVIPAADALVAQQGAVANTIGQFSSPLTDAVNREQFAKIGRTLTTVEQRIIDMDRMGVDIQAISPSPSQYHYHAPPELGRQAAQIVNNGIAEAVAKHRERFVGIGTVPLQSPELAIAEMKRCANALDLRGIEINTNVAGRELSAEEFRPFFAAAEELGMLLFMHPLGFTHGQRLSEHYFNNLIGNPLESTIAVGHLIFGGVLDRHPGLKMCVAHGGGYLPTYWGRMDHAWRARSDCREHISRAPSSYLRQLYLDTVVYEREQLEFLVKTHGADKICLGTDYPFDMSEPDPVGFVSALPENDREKILGLNAAQLLKIETRAAP